MTSTHDHLIGREWPSINGPRRVTGVREVGGQARLEIQTGDTNIRELLPPDELEREIKLDTSRVTGRAAAKAELAAADDEYKRLPFDDKGFLATFKPMQAARVATALRRGRNYKGRVVPVGVIVSQLVNDGFRVQVAKGGDRRLAGADGAFFDEKALTKWGLDFAEHLARKDESMSKHYATAGKDRLDEMDPVIAIGAIGSLAVGGAIGAGVVKAWRTIKDLLAAGKQSAAERTFDALSKSDKAVLRMAAKKRAAAEGLDESWPPEIDEKAFKAWLRKVDAGLQEQLRLRSRDIPAPVRKWFAEDVSVEDAIARIVKVAKDTAKRPPHESLDEYTGGWPTMLPVASDTLTPGEDTVISWPKQGQLLKPGERHVPHVERDAGWLVRNYEAVRSFSVERATGDNPNLDCVVIGHTDGGAMVAVGFESKALARAFLERPCFDGKRVSWFGSEQTIGEGMFDFTHTLQRLDEMAKLSARGRTELLRMALEREVPDDDLISWERTTEAYMSDGRVLKKRDVRFLPDSYRPEGRRHTYGWKDDGRMKPDLMKNPAALRAALQKLRDARKAKGWSIEADTTSELPQSPLVGEAREGAYVVWMRAKPHGQMVIGVYADKSVAKQAREANAADNAHVTFVSGVKGVGSVREWTKLRDAQIQAYYKKLGASAWGVADFSLGDSGDMDEGRTSTPPLVYELFNTSGGSVSSPPMAWRVSGRGANNPGMGKPTEANLKKAIDDYNTSLEADGANDHLVSTFGKDRVTAVGGIIRRNEGRDSEILARYGKLPARLNVSEDIIVEADSDEFKVSFGPKWLPVASKRPWVLADAKGNHLRENGASGKTLTFPDANEALKYVNDPRNARVFEKAYNAGIGREDEALEESASRDKLQRAYDAALKEMREEHARYVKVLTAYRAREIEDGAFLRARMKLDAAHRVVDAAEAALTQASETTFQASNGMLVEVSPPGFAGTVKAMKKHGDIDNPYALAWWMQKRGAKSTYKADGTKKKSASEDVVAVGPIDQETLLAYANESDVLLALAPHLHTPRQLDEAAAGVEAVEVMRINTRPKLSKEQAMSPLVTVASADAHATYCVYSDGTVVRDQYRDGRPTRTIVAEVPPSNLEGVVDALREIVASYAGPDTIADVVVTVGEAIDEDVRRVKHGKTEWRITSAKRGNLNAPVQAFVYDTRNAATVWTATYKGGEITYTATGGKTQERPPAEVMKDVESMLRSIANNVGQESVDEADLSVAKTIIAQLGGNRFTAMTGAKNFVGSDNSVTFQIGRNEKGVNRVRITLDPSDTYTVEFLSVRGTTVKVKSKVEGVYVDTLRDVFTEHTGLYTSLGTTGRKTTDEAKVNLSGATYTLVRKNSDGTITVKNDNGDEFDSAPGEAYTMLTDAPAKSNGPDPRKMSRSSFIAAERKALQATRQAALDAVVKRIESTYQTEALPTGASKVQALLAAPRLKPDERKLRTEYRVAKANVDADYRSNEATWGAVWDRMNANLGESTDTLSAVRKVLMQNPGRAFSLKQLVMAVSGDESDVLRAASRLVNAGTASYSRGEGYALAGSSSGGLKRSTAKPSGARVSDQRTYDYTQSDAERAAKRKSRLTLGEATGFAVVRGEKDALEYWTGDGWTADKAEAKFFETKDESNAEAERLASEADETTLSGAVGGFRSYPLGKQPKTPINIGSVPDDEADVDDDDEEEDESIVEAKGVTAARVKGSAGWKAALTFRDGAGRQVVTDADLKVAFVAVREVMDELNLDAKTLARSTRSPLVGDATPFTVFDLIVYHSAFQPKSWILSRFQHFKQASTNEGADTCAGCGEPWPCSDSKRRDISGRERAKHYVAQRKDESRAEDIKVGDRVEYGPSSKAKGFPRRDDQVGTVTKIHVQAGVTYASVKLPSGKVLSYPADAFTKVEESMGVGDTSIEVVKRKGKWYVVPPDGTAESVFPDKESAITAARGIATREHYAVVVTIGEAKRADEGLDEKLSDFQLDIEWQNGGYSVTFPELRGPVGSGYQDEYPFETLPEALAFARQEALRQNLIVVVWNLKPGDTYSANDGAASESAEALETVTVNEAQVGAFTLAAQAAGLSENTEVHYDQGVFTVELPPAQAARVRELLAVC